MALQTAKDKNRGCPWLSSSPRIDSAAGFVRVSLHPMGRRARIALAQEKHNEHAFHHQAGICAPRRECRCGWRSHQVHTAAGRARGIRRRGGAQDSLRLHRHRDSRLRSAAISETGAHRRPRRHGGPLRHASEGGAGGLWRGCPHDPRLSLAARPQGCRCRDCGRR